LEKDVSKLPIRYEVGAGTIPITGQDQAMLLDAGLDIVKETLRCFTAYMQCKEQEETKRRYIKAKLRSIEAEIAAKKEIYLEALDKAYEERHRLYSIAEKVQQTALERGDMEMLKMCCNFILNVYGKPVKVFDLDTKLIDE
jgi:hypothetical protein